MESKEIKLILITTDEFTKTQKSDPITILQGINIQKNNLIPTNNDSESELCWRKNVNVGGNEEILVKEEEDI